MQKAAYSRLKKGFSTPLGKATETNWYFFCYDTTSSILGDVGFIVYFRNSSQKNKSFGKIQMIIFKTLVTEFPAVFELGFCGSGLRLVS